MIRFYNTLSGTLEEFRPIRPGKAGIYTCGPTVYDYIHIGNLRAYVFEDLLRRFLAFEGYEVTHVMNITDVDDKTIKGANARGVSLGEYTKRFEEGFFEDIRTMRILPAHVYPKATEHIPDMVRMIKTLMAKGFAYEKDGSVYFSIAKFPSYGRLAKIHLDDLVAGNRVQSDEYEKESIHDFALWKKKKDGEPSWTTEIGEGRPGWHIECSAMSSKYLGDSFDIHCGGVDNIFPHHENEIAQSEAASGVKFVNYWLHCHHLVRDGEKMSKSLGNTLALKDVLEREKDPLVLRFLLLSIHYRKGLNFTWNALEQARATRQRLVDFVFELGSRTFPDTENAEIPPLVTRARDAFRAGLSDDLNISSALAALFDFVRTVNTLVSRDGIGARDAARILGFVRDADRVLAVLPEAEVEADSLPPDLARMIDDREKARREKNYPLADELRQKLLGRGISLEDTKDGARWKRIKK